MARMLVPLEMGMTPAERLLNRFFDFNPFFGVREEWSPASDVAETEKTYVVTMELPGIDMKKLDITYHEGTLSVRGNKEKEDSEGESCYCSERFSGSFSRSIEIPGVVDKEKIEATYKDGILRLVLPKSEEHAPKKIEVH